MWPPWAGGCSGHTTPPTQGGHIGPPLHAPSYFRTERAARSLALLRLPGTLEVGGSMFGHLSGKETTMRKKLTYLGLGLALTVAALISSARPVQASNCVTDCSTGCCSTCCQISPTKWVCTYRP